MHDGVIAAEPVALSSLHEETLRIGRLVADLETLASADAAGFTLAPVQTDLDVLLGEVAAEFAGLADARDVAITVDAEPVRLVIDPSRIKQVVANLVSNAVKFSPEGGAVSLSLRRDGDEACVEVSDNGPGIPEDELPHVFERFFRGRDVRAGGSGIGLSVARELVLAHHGSLTVTSHLGDGARFEMKLSVSAPVAATTAQTSDRSS
jgi:signal transduction histidine kinase